MQKMVSRCDSLVAILSDRLELLERLTVIIMLMIMEGCDDFSTTGLIRAETSVSHVMHSVLEINVPPETVANAAVTAQRLVSIL